MKCLIALSGFHKMSIVDELKGKIVYIFSDYSSDGLIFEEEGTMYLRVIHDGKRITEKYYLTPGRYLYIRNQFALLDADRKRIVKSFEENFATYVDLEIPGAIRCVLENGNIVSLLFNVIQIHFLAGKNIITRCSYSGLDNVFQILPHSQKGMLAITGMKNGENVLCIFDVTSECVVFCRKSGSVKIISFDQSLLIEENGLRRELKIIPDEEWNEEMRGKFKAGNSPIGSFYINPLDPLLT